MSDSTNNTENLDSYGVWVKHPVQNIEEDSTKIENVESTDLDNFDIPEISASEPAEKTEVSDFELPEEDGEIDLDNFMSDNDSSTPAEVSADDFMNDSSSGDGEVSVDDFMSDSSSSDGEISVDDFMSDSGSGDGEVSLDSFMDAGSSGEIDLDAFMGDEGFSGGSSGGASSKKQDDVQDNDALNISVDFNENKDNSVEVREITEEDDLPSEDYNSQPENSDSTSEFSTSSLGDSEDVDLSDFGIDSDAEETPVTDNVKQGKNSDVVDYNLLISDDDQGDSSMPVVEEIKSEEKVEQPVENTAETAKTKVPEGSTVVNTELLQQIVNDLSSLKTEISTLKNNFEQLKSNPTIDPRLNTEHAEESSEHSAKSSGFFQTDDEDDTIALSGDELTNIVNSSDIFEEDKTEETAEQEEIEIPEADLEATIEEPDVVENIEEPVTEELSIDEPLTENVSAEEPVIENIEDNFELPEEDIVENSTEEVIPTEDNSENSATEEISEPVLSETAFDEPKIEENIEITPEEIETKNEVVDFTEENTVLDVEDNFEISSDNITTETLAEETVVEEPVVDEIIDEDKVSLDSIEPKVEDISEIEPEKNEENEISLTDSELENIESSANFNDEKEEIKDEDENIFGELDDDFEISEEPEIDSGLSIDIDESKLEEPNLDSIEGTDEDNEISIPKVEDFNSDDMFVESSDKEDLMESVSVDDEISDDIFEPELENKTENKEETSSTDEIPTVESLTNGLEEPSENVFKNAFEKEEPQISTDEIEVEDIADDNFDDIVDIADEPEEVTAPETVDIPEDTNVEKPEENTQNLSSNIQKDVKSVLLYMDKLLESLPEEKIREFAASEQFETYKKLFNELGLINQ